MRSFLCISWCIFVHVAQSQPSSMPSNQTGKMGFNAPSLEYHFCLCSGAGHILSHLLSRHYAMWSLGTTKNNKETPITPEISRMQRLPVPNWRQRPGEFFVPLWVRCERQETSRSRGKLRALFCSLFALGTEPQQYPWCASPWLLLPLTLKRCWCSTDCNVTQDLLPSIVHLKHTEHFVCVCT